MYLGYNEGDVERDEASANRRFLQAQKLPKDGDWTTLEKWGVQKLTESEDHLFYSVNLPQGWEILAGEEHREGLLIDEHGFVRATTFVKITSYDRLAFMSVIADRYKAREFSDLCFKVYDNGGRIWVRQEFPVGQYAQARVEERFLWFFKRKKYCYGLLFEGVFYYEPCERVFQKHFECLEAKVIDADALQDASYDIYRDIKDAAYSICSKQASDYAKTMRGW